tara:strand:+ start:839 stop:1390 length:552 start_codon:yes stop_codon:yes gene_type:complete
MKLLSLSNKKSKFSGENFSCFPRITRKKGVSLLISYVLLITIAVALSVLVYNWLRLYVQDSELEICKDGITIVIQDYECLLPSGEVDGSLNVTIKNKGRFNIDGWALKVSDRVGGKIGLYNFTSDGVTLVPAETNNTKYLFSEVDNNDSELVSITMIEVQPFVVENGDRTYCESVSSQSVTCS